MLPLEDFREICYLKIFPKSADEIQGSLISDKKTGILHK
jgi:hypothetical protein